MKLSRLYLAKPGFILPATIMLGLAISIISATFAQYIVSSSQTLNNQTFTGLAQEAASSGISYAVGCYSSNTTTWSTLRPDSGCSGTPVSGASPYMAVSPDSSWRSKFSVAQPAVANGNQKRIVSTGTIEVLIGNIIVNTITATKIVTITTSVGTTPVASGDAITDLSVDSHSCATANGKLYCWGLNDVGQLGTGDTSDRNTPTIVANTNPSDVFYNKVITTVEVGTGDTCAIADGQLYCWGDNTYGQLGNGVVGGNQTIPQLVTSLSGRKITNLAVSQSATGPKSVCAVADGIPYCWGANSNQQLGLSTTFIDATNRSTPTPIYGYKTGEGASKLSGKKVQSASVGAHSGCATAVGKMYCWGNINSTTTLSSVADMSGQGSYPYVSMVQPNSVKVIGDFSCSIPTVLVCQGRSGAYAGGAEYTSPTQLTYTSPSSDYDIGDNTSTTGDGLSCGVYADIYCTGNNTGAAYAGAVTGSTDTSSRAPFRVGTGNQFGCMVSNGALLCWGKETNGQLADGSMTGSSVYPKLVAQNVIGTDNALAGTYPKFTAPGSIASGANHECGISNGTIFCWGHNNNGQLGVGGYTDQAEPTNVDTSNYPTFFFIPINIAMVKVTAGGDHSCSITGNGAIFFGGTSVYCWGLNSSGELGFGNTTTSDIPQTVSGLSGDTTDISAGAKNTCSVSGSQAYCWGDRSTGIIGDGNTTGLQTTPQLISAFAGKQVSAISVGTSHACAIVNGDGYCWGSNTNSATGLLDTSSVAINSGITLPANGKITAGLAATTTNGLSAAFTAISAGNNFTCAIINGAAACWGKNDKSQTGNGGTSDVTVPTALASPGTTLQANSIDAGNQHACAVLQGNLYCWGDNTSGQIGSGTFGSTQPTPYLVNGGAATGRVSINVSAGGANSCSVSNGLILCWGAGAWGQIGNTGLVDVSTPAAISSYRTKGTYSTGQIY